jgi:5-hydroxyisourate hydrolase
MGISTHVLDTAAGRPAAGVLVRLARRGGAEWTELAQRDTDDDGRIADFVAEVAPGVYRMTFDVAGYAGADSFYPEVVVTFRVVDGSAHHHVPLLLSPYGYTTYRGS